MSASENQATLCLGTFINRYSTTTPTAALPKWMAAAAGTHNGLAGDASASTPLDTQMVTAVLRLGCAGADGAAADALCMPAEEVKGVVAAALGDGMCVGWDGDVLYFAWLELPSPPSINTPHHTTRLRPRERRPPGPLQARGPRRERARHHRVRACPFLWGGGRVRSTTTKDETLTLFIVTYLLWMDERRPLTDVARTSGYDLTFTTHEQACTAAVTAWVKGAFAFIPPPLMH